MKLKAQHISNFLYIKKEYGVKNVNCQNIDNSQLKLWHKKISPFECKRFDKSYKK